MQWNPVEDCEDLRLKQGSNPGSASHRLTELPGLLSGETGDGSI